MSIDWVPMGRSGGSRGEDRVMYRRQVRHRWTKHSLRPHLNPSVEKVRPKLNRRIARAIARELAAA